MIEFILEISFNKVISDLQDLFIKKPLFRHQYSTDKIEFIAWGDPIVSDNFNAYLEKDTEVSFIINNLYGQYYFLLLQKQEKKISFGNSLFSILPIYYYQNTEGLILSENSLSIGEYLGINTKSHRFILETVLFNYPLFNHSIIEGIKLVPSNSFLSLTSNEYQITKHTYIEKYFSDSPEAWNKSVTTIRDVFLDRVYGYLPEKHYINALTGGFDGRTLVSSGLYFKKEFSCYSFGTSSSKDTEIASKLASRAGIPFINLILDKSFVENHSLECGLEFIRNASGTATFARAHYLYAAKQLGNISGHVITGNFGSEIFRAAHIPGVVFAPNLITLFNASSLEDAILSIENSNEFSYLNIEYYKTEWDQLKFELYSLPCYNPEFKYLTLNQKFYVFVFEEVFRKYFGAEMVNQFKYIKNRTPFLDINLMKAIFKTELAGIHSGFFEQNPIKRYKGQVLYAHIIRKTFPLFGRMMTDKGYRPDDLIDFTGKINIIKGYIKKLLRNKNLDSDPYSVIHAWAYNSEFFKQIPIDPELFQAERIKQELPSKRTDVLFKILSISYIVKLLANKLVRWKE